MTKQCLIAGAYILLFSGACWSADSTIADKTGQCKDGCCVVGGSRICSQIVPPGDDKVISMPDADFKTLEKLLTIDNSQK